MGHGKIGVDNVLSLQVLYIRIRIQIDLGLFQKNNFEILIVNFKMEGFN